MSSNLESKQSNKERSHQVTPPSISLPKGGGAIRGIGEKFAANPVTGTGSLSIPIAASPGRGGFDPQLSLSYDSGAGNSPFGFGWNLSLPAITRKTDKGLPQYRDADESDVFLLSGAEDLVPELNPDGSRLADTTTAHNVVIHRYRPRVEGLFARIERWTHLLDGSVHWRALSRDNIQTIYGKDGRSRIFDPSDPSRIFSWLICESRDDKGNAIVYDYKPEDGVGVAVIQAHERNRGPADDPGRTAARYIKRIRYGNRLSLLDAAHRRTPGPLIDADIDGTEWFFELVFDYGEHDAVTPTPAETSPWPPRPDPFSSYRSGFEVRIGRRCKRVLMFHHFAADAESPGYDGLSRSTDFKYRDERSAPRAEESEGSPRYSFLLSVTHTSYQANGSGYRSRSLPPVEFAYSQPIVQDRVEEADPLSVENLPIGIDGQRFQWTDLHGEGIPGILTETTAGWHYKRNLSPIGGESVAFAPMEQVALRPNMRLSSGAQFMDLAGDGQSDLVALEDPTPGYYEHDEAEGWNPFRPFTARLHIDTRDPNVRLIDLDGDGHADVLITEDDALVWHASLAEAGFGPARRVALALDEETGPRLVFADGTQSIYLADMSGDGLTDLVRIRNGEVSYWPNLGHCRFGARVTMDDAPHFDQPDQFAQRRVRVADIDGSGTSDIIYLHRDGVRLYFNQSGNSWSEPQLLEFSPRVDELTRIVPVDLLGNGTACLVWSSPLPGDALHPIRFVNLMGGQKPHLLIKVSNSLGAVTEIEYAPSTRFYLADKLAGKPWITKLPFPVHVVERVTVSDKWRGTTFASRYSYHHGYFDGVEREFRGFGRVEQIDTEDFGIFAAGNAGSPYITPDLELYQPPVKTVTWFHTGVYLGRDRVLSQYQDEYFRGFAERVLPEPDLAETGLTHDEWREALRACKGMVLRQEVYELDVDALARGEHLSVRLFNTAHHNCHIRRLQPRGTNRHAVFLVTESEALSYHYELDLRDPAVEPDPRITHTLNLNIDDYGNVLQAVAVAYPRRVEYADSSLDRDTVERIRAVQTERHLVYTETRFTDDVIAPDTYRLRVPCEVKNFEVTGIMPGSGAADEYFTLEALRRYRLSATYQPTGEAVTEVAYHEQAPGGPHKRWVEHVRMRFFVSDPSMSGFLQEALPFGQQGSRGLPYETYKLALTEALAGAVLGDKLTPEVRAALANPARSGYMYDTTAGQYWVRSGIAGFEPDAAAHFFLPERYTDPFGHTTTLDYDDRDLFVRSTTDPLHNTVAVTAFDYRVLAPSAMRDINDNLSEVAFDVLGLPTAMALRGKGDQGDNLASLTPEIIDPESGERTGFFADAYDEEKARDFLGTATARHIYSFGEAVNASGDVIAWGVRPPCAAAIVRETHVAQALETGAATQLQLAFEYSDGGGNVLVKKVQAEPETEGGPLRWIASGKTILNNKGKPVKQYEPYFSETEHRFDEPRREIGVTPVMYYDAAGRVVRTELPDGSFSRVEFSPWHVTQLRSERHRSGSAWYQSTYVIVSTPIATMPRSCAIMAPPAESTRRAAGRQARRHPGMRPSSTASVETSLLVAHNRVAGCTPGTWRDEKYPTFTKLDAEGKPLWIRDARGNLVMQYITASSSLPRCARS